MIDALFENFVSTLEKVKDTQEDITESTYELADLDLEAIEYTLEVKLEVTEEDRKLIDWLKSME